MFPDQLQEFIKSIQADIKKKKPALRPSEEYGLAIN